MSIWTRKAKPYEYLAITKLIFELSESLDKMDVLGNEQEILEQLLAESIIHFNF